MRQGLPNLTAMTALAGAMVLLIAGLMISAFNERAYQVRRTEALTAQAEVLARTVAPALVFEDPAAAAELVGAMEGNVQIALAGVYDARGALIARFARPGAASRGGPAAGSAGRVLSVAVPVTHERRRIGAVVLETRAEPAAALVTRHAGAALLLVMAVLMVAAAQAAVRAQTRAARESAARAGELAELNAALQLQVERRETAEEALRQAQKMETLGQLTGGIAHDFNNLLQAVQGSLDMIVRHPQDTDRVTRWGRAGLDAAERGARLTAQLLAFSRSQKLELRPVDVADVMGRIHALVPGALGAGVRLSFHEPEDLWVVADATQLELAVLNLCINARDAMPNGGEIHVSARSEIVADDPELADGRYVRLAVRDTGVGMPKDVQARAFEPFFTTKGVGKGTGLGLAQVYGIARQAGGLARIESRPGSGTTVSLILPSVDAPAPLRSAAPLQQDAVAPAVGGRVLVIDDDVGVRAYVCDALVSLGYACIEAADGPSGLSILEQEPVDLLIVDYAMPGMNGAEVAAQALVQRPDLPVLFASGYAESDALERALGRPAPMIRKPFDTASLAKRVAEALNAECRPRIGAGNP